jgi:hypothetical protein
LATGFLLASVLVFVSEAFVFLAEAVVAVVPVGVLAAVKTLFLM